MNRDFVISIIKFLNRIDATVNIELERRYRNRQGNQVVCMKVEVKFKGKTHYLQYHCYSMKNNKITYDEGNEVVPIKNGILAYLGNPNVVDNYFDELARTEAKKYFEQ
jgi:hypothetical protein